MKNDKPVTQPKNVDKEKWGDSEHDTRLHKNLKAHKGKPEYDPRYKAYKD